MLSLGCSCRLRAGEWVVPDVGCQLSGRRAPSSAGPSFIKLALRLASGRSIFEVGVTIWRSGRPEEQRQCKPHDVMGHESIDMANRKAKELGI